MPKSHNETLTLMKIGNSTNQRGAYANPDKAQEILC